MILKEELCLEKHLTLTRNGCTIRPSEISILDLENTICGALSFSSSTIISTLAGTELRPPVNVCSNFVANKLNCYKKL